MHRCSAFDNEIVPVTAIKMIMNKETGEVTKEEVTLTKMREIVQEQQSKTWQI